MGIFEPGSKAFVPMAAAGLLLIAVGTLEFLQEPNRVDQAVLAVVAQWRTPVLDRAMAILTHAGGLFATLLLLGVVAAPLYLRKRIRAILVVFVSVFGAAALASTIKELVGRARPPAPLMEAGGYAFPSWHAAVSAALAVSLFAVFYHRVAPRLRPLFVSGLLGWPLLVGASRIYLQVHWASDVLAGWGVGLAWAAFAALILREKGDGHGDA